MPALSGVQGMGADLLKAERETAGPALVSSAVPQAAARGPAAAVSPQSLVGNGALKQRAAVAGQGPGWNLFAFQGAAGNRAVQRWARGGGASSPAGVHRAAQAGVAGPGGRLPHYQAIQRSFGPGHDLSGVQAHVGGPAAAASAAMHATAFTAGEHVGFKAQPDLWLAAHEAAHVVQQRGGVSLFGGVGRAGDRYERQADTVADRVVSGRPAHDLLAGSRAAGRAAVQRCGGVVHEGCDCAKEAGETKKVEETAGGTSVAVQRNGDGGFLEEVGGALSSAVSTVESAAGEVATDVKSAAGTVASAAGEVASDVGSAVSSAAKAAGGAVSDAAAEVEGAVSAGISAVKTGVSAAVSWAETEAGKLALKAVGWLASQFGATVTVVGTGIRVDIPEIPLFSAHQSDPVEMPRLALPFPLLAGGGALGPVIFEGGIFAELAAEPRAAVILGPGSIRHISLMIDPLAGTGAATGQLHVAGSAAVALPIEVGLDAEGMIIILAGEVPIPIEADAFGGLRLTLQLSALGSLAETVGLVYSSGALTLGLQSQLSLGARLDARLDATVEVNVEDLTVCEYVWPLKSWPLGNVAEQFSFPLSMGYSSSGPSFSAGPASAKPIPIESIEAVLPQWVAMQDCKSLDEIIAHLCKKGVLPPGLCAPQPQGPSPLPVLPAAPGGGGGGGPGPGGGGTVPPTLAYPSGLTSRDPIPIIWFKPLGLYPDPITLSDSVGNINEYDMDRPGQFVEPGSNIGVTANFLPRIGKKVHLEQGHRG